MSTTTSWSADVNGEGRFPKIALKTTQGHERTITLFGLAEPMTLFQKHAVDSKRALEEAISGFGPKDYVMVCAHDKGLAAQAFAKAGMQSPLCYHENVEDWTQEGLIDVYPRLRFAERFEFYKAFAFSPAELKLWSKLGDGTLQTLPKLLDENAPHEARSLFEETWPERPVVEESKKHTLSMYLHSLGLSEDEASLLLEYAGSFRNFITARTVLWRAELFNIKLFVPKFSIAELVDFLTIQDALDQYTEKLQNIDEALLAIWSRNEVIQRTITDRAICRRDQVLLPNFSMVFVNWLVQVMHEVDYGLRLPQLDFSEYRTRLINMSERTAQSAPCFCFSGQSHGECFCSKYIRGLRAFGPLSTQRKARRQRRLPKPIHAGKRRRKKRRK